ncbi:methylenetetrahydrofolate reductase [Thermovibrio ammonificans]|uniref:Methylenetetrahydrofolate reductase n=1 Tax=Thermovibrio ammonificans (strain DSM 15698 / JCM 12110 / HB-1) TaxID=648996 RepID=E8T1Z1_THEA1|nr:methylenetetrahydrofolate reductase [Thermovibrio ammonificans]ADU96886.1 methylenetetrahydrofolate reductase [Thermovibrio ammonificans HB-1]
MSFRQKLEAGKFVITAEVAPPRGTVFSLEALEPLKGKVDAFNVTDCQRSMVRMSPLVAAKLLLDAGFEPVLQLTCRDRNRIALQADLLGAWALGLENLCLMTGDFTTLGDQPDAKPVFDLDSVQLIELASSLNGGKLLNGKEIDHPTDFFIGAVFNPFAGPERLQLFKLEKKVKAGARFIQTQPVYSLEVAQRACSQIREAGAVPIVGLLPVKSLKMASFIEKLNPGSVPPSLLEGLERSRDPARYGWEFILELAEAVTEFAGGVHFMLTGRPDQLARFIDYLRNSSPYNHRF